MLLDVVADLQYHLAPAFPRSLLSICSVALYDVWIRLLGIGHTTSVAAPCLNYNIVFGIQSTAES
jgi:hypothetical protein